MQTSPERGHYYALYPALRQARDFAVAHAAARGLCTRTLAGACVPAAARLSQELFRKGIVHRVAVAERPVGSRDQEAHAYVLCGQFVLDVTASQFGEANLVLLSRTEAATRWYWRAERTFDCPLSLLRWQCATQWPAEQRLPRYLAERWAKERRAASHDPEDAAAWAAVSGRRRASAAAPAG